MSTLAPAAAETPEGGEARRVTQLLGSTADLIVPDKNPAEMDSLERVHWTIRRRRLVDSLVGHLLGALNEWEPPVEAEPAQAADTPQTLR